MKRLFFALLISVTCLFSFNKSAYSQPADTTFYLITCGPGTETYSIYGHSALRVVNGNSDIVFNWGVFDFDTPNFAWKFAKGRLDYMLAYESFNDFLRSYFYEERYVLMQKINLTSEEKKRMLELINENLEPENLKYRYDFFYDDCSTRIRDLIENSVSRSLIYPDEIQSTKPSFRQMLDKYQRPYPWLDFGIDLLLGHPADLKADVRDRMFLPIDMMEGLSSTVLHSEASESPLLEKSELVLDFEPPVMESIPTPFLIFSIIFLGMLMVSLFVKSIPVINIIDIIIYFTFSLISILLVFFNFFSEHGQLKMNFNLVWLNPLILLCLISLVLNRKDEMLFRLVFYITALFIAVHLFIPQEFNIANYPLILILLLRSMARSDFKWNPVMVKQ